MVNNYFNITRLRTSLLFLCSMLVTLTSVAQTTFNFDATAPGYVAAGDDRHPLGCYFGYERSQFIYTAAELGNLPVGSIIDSVGFFLTTYNVPPELDYDFKIYVREVGSPTVTGSAFAPLAGASVLRFTSPPPMNHNNLGACGLSGPLNRWITTYLNLGTSQITSGSNLEFLVEDNWGSSAGTAFDPNGWFINNSICGAGAGVGFFNSIMFAQNNKTASGQYWNADNNPPSFNGFATNFRPNIHIVSHLAPPCVGVPAAGVIQATTSANPVCGSPFSLGLTGVPGASGFTFQWDSSTTSAAGPWGPIAGATQMSTLS